MTAYGSPILTYLLHVVWLIMMLELKTEGQ